MNLVKTGSDLAWGPGVPTSELGEVISLLLNVFTFMFWGHEPRITLGILGWLWSRVKRSKLWLGKSESPWCRSPWAHGRQGDRGQCDSSYPLAQGWGSRMEMALGLGWNLTGLRKTVTQQIDLILVSEIDLNSWMSFGTLLEIWRVPTAWPVYRNGKYTRA